jgi:hypothetical protein
MRSIERPDQSGLCKGSSCWGKLGWPVGQQQFGLLGLYAPLSLRFPPRSFLVKKVGGESFLHHQIMTVQTTPHFGGSRGLVFKYTQDLHALRPDASAD